MTGLTQVAINARKGIRYGIFFIIFIIVGKFLLDSGVAIYKKVFPAPPPPPTVKFGKLTKIPFPSSSPVPKINYVLETPEGGLPTNISGQAKVFFMPKISANLLSLDVAKNKAKVLEFTKDPVQVSDTVYKFGSPNFPSILEINIITGVFSISYDLIADRSPIVTKPPIAEVAASEYRSALSIAGVLPADLTGPVTHNFLKLSDGKLISALSLSESDLIEVSLFRKQYDDLPSVTGDPNKANVWAIVSGSSNKRQQLIAAEYHYFPVDETQFSTYPIKTPTEAYAEFTAGNAFVADMGLTKDGDTLKIRRVYLAYFDPDTITDFFQPIYVFEGDNGFTAYLPAIKADYYGE